MLSSAKSRKSRRLLVPVLVISMILGLFPVPGFSGSPYTIYPTADASVLSNAPTSNFGTDTQLLTGIYGATTLAYYRTYFKFDLGVIPSSEQITGGTLYGYCLSKTPSSVTLSMQLRPVSDTTWNEVNPNGITWNNKPDYGDVITTTTTLASGGINRWYAWSIPAAKLPATGLVSFMLMSSNTGYAYLYSRNNGSNKPYLVVTTKKKPLSPAANNLLLLDE